MVLGGLEVDEGIQFHVEAVVDTVGYTKIFEDIESLTIGRLARVYILNDGREGTCGERESDDSNHHDYAG